MRIDRLDALEGSGDLTADLVIVGGGPAAFAVSQEFRGSNIRVLILESGVLEQNADHDALNTVESVGEPKGPAQDGKRQQFHSESLPFWSHQTQGFGVRCRVLGGGTQVWAGKSAAFDPQDYNIRDWVSHSGWPIDGSVMAPFIDRAAVLLNLGPNCYDDGFWSLIGAPPPDPPLDPELIRSFFWQFARSRTHRLDFVRFGREYAAFEAPNVRVIINATVRKLVSHTDSGAFSHLDVSTVDGRVWRVRARAAVLAAGAIENARLLLVSGHGTEHSMGNGNDLVGRFLLDHPSARIGRFAQKDCAAITRRFGFYSLNHSRQSHIFLHGVALSPELQKREKLLNCAAYMMEDRAPDDPWEALKRLMSAKSAAPGADIGHALAGGGLMLKGLAARSVTSGRMPPLLRKLVMEGIARRFPNMAVREYRDRGLPHKLLGIDLDAVTEQTPDAESRVTLSERKDRLGVPLAHIDWRIDIRARQSLMRIGHVVRSEFRRIGLPEPALEPWVAEERLADGPIIDMAHTAGTTRMADSPVTGVVDPDCQVFGVPNLYVAGASVFPTSGHANPTLMIMALAIRLADHLKVSLGARADGRTIAG